jgi:hypothetical protein
MKDVLYVSLLRNGSSNCDSVLASSILPQVYAHHEREVGNCRCHDNKRNSGIFTSTYFKFYDSSAPKRNGTTRIDFTVFTFPSLLFPASLSTDQLPKLQPALASILAELQTKQNPSQRQYSEPLISSFTISSIFGQSPPDVCNRSCRNSLEECLLVGDVYALVA